MNLVSNIRLSLHSRGYVGMWAQRAVARCMPRRRWFSGRIARVSVARAGPRTAPLV